MIATKPKPDVRRLASSTRKMRIALPTMPSTGSIASS
jgi:hypothetical protein